MELLHGLGDVRSLGAWWEDEEEGGRERGRGFAATSSCEREAGGRLEEMGHTPGLYSPTRRR